MKKIIFTVSLIAAVSFAMPQSVSAKSHADEGNKDVEVPLNGGILALLLGAGTIFTVYKRKALRA